MKELEYPVQSVPKDRRFCTICGKIKRLSSFEGDSTYCADCRREMLHTRFPRWSLPVVAVVLVLAAASVILSVHTVPLCMDLFRAEKAERERRLSDACTLYRSVVEEAPEHNAALVPKTKADEENGVPAMPKMVVFEAGARTWRHYLDLYSEVYSESVAAKVANRSLHESASSVIPRLDQLYEARQAYIATTKYANALDEKYGVKSAEKMPYDKIIADLTAYEEESDSRYVKGYTEYYKGTATLYHHTEDPAAAIPYFQKLLEYVPLAYVTAYSSIAEAAMRADDYETAMQAYDAILERNINYSDNINKIAEAAFRTGNTEKLELALAHYDAEDPQRLQMEMRFALLADDLDGAAQVRKHANETLRVQADQVFNKMLAEKNIDSDGIGVLWGYAEFAMYDAAYSLLRGDTDEAFELAYTLGFNYAYYYAYITGDSDVFTQPILNMTTLCASLAKDNEAIRTIRSIGACDETTQKVIDGELTVRDVFVEGKASIL